MKSRMLSLTFVGAFSMASVSAFAEPVQLTDAEMDQVSAGASFFFVNPGGNIPPGQINKFFRRFF